MTPFPSQRSAEEFARVVDGSDDPESTGRYDGLIAAVTLLRQQPRPLPRPAFVADLRAQLMAAAQTELGTEPTSVRPLELRRRRARWHERHLGGAVAALVLVGGSAGVAAAAQGALPGDTLYPVKRGMESVQVRISSDDAARGRELLEQAGTRLREARALSGASGSTGVLIDTVDAFSASADRGARLLFTAYRADARAEDIGTVRTFAATSLTQLSRLGGDLDGDPGLTDALARAAGVLADIDQQARVLCAACSDEPALSLPEALAGTDSAPTLRALVAVPTRQAARAAALAKAAEAQAREAEESAGALPSGTPSTPPPSAPATGAEDQPQAGTDEPPQDDARPPARPSEAQPVKDLLTGLTDATAPVVGGLGSTIEGVTGLVGDTVGGLTQGLSDTLGGLGLGGKASTGTGTGTGTGQ